jgi:hypothetical protein
VFLQPAFCKAAMCGMIDGGVCMLFAVEDCVGVAFGAVRRFGYMWEPDQRHLLVCALWQV